MAKFNASTIGATLTKNNEGAVAYSMTDKEKLMTQVLTSMFNEDKFYGDNSKYLIKTAGKLIDTDTKFVANLCLYARNEMHLRSVSHALMGELANHEKGKKYVRKAINRIVERVDDMTEILSYYLSNYKKPIPNSIKRGLADAFVRFDEYQIAKYNRDNAVKLKDVLCIAHPKPKNDKQSDLFKRVLEDRLETPVTWETELSAKGNTQESWEKLIAENKIGYMAALRNLRNIIKANPTNINKIYDMLADEEKVLKSKQLPFRFYSAYKTLQDEGIGTSKVYDALEKAIKASTKNITKLLGKTFISADVSGSMASNNISQKSTTVCAEIAVLLMALANYICEETITTTFDTSLCLCQLSTQNGILANAKSISVNGGGTDITLPLKYLLEKKIVVDRIIIFSDNEINDKYDHTCQGYVDEYRRTTNPDVWVHAIDLQGYGTQQFKGKNVNLIAGWSEKVLEFIHTAEVGIETIMQKVENYYFEK